MQLLEYFNLPKPKEHTVFRQTHYKNYIRLVIKNTYIKNLIEEASKYKNTPHASEQLGQYLDKIKDIEDESKILPQKYETFLRSYKRTFDLNEGARRKMKMEEEKRNQRAKL